MPGTPKRISVYLSEEEHALVSNRALRAGMKIPAYLRRVACGELPRAKTRDFVINGLADVANELDLAADDEKQGKSKRVLLAARDRLRGLLKQHLATDSDRQSR